jgi:hypothetical protein
MRELRVKNADLCNSPIPPVKIRSLDIDSRQVLTCLLKVVEPGHQMRFKYLGGSSIYKFQGSEHPAFFKGPMGSLVSLSQHHKSTINIVDSQS